MREIKNGVSVRVPYNRAEEECYIKMQDAGWTAIKTGWPDFFCFRDGEICVVEVKPKKTHSLKRNQIAILKKLAEAGIRSYKWTPDGGFEKIH